MDKNKIKHAIQFNQGAPFYMELEWIEVLEHALTVETKVYIEKGNIDLRILADVIKQTMSEKQDEKQINGILWDKLHDWNLVVGLKKKYGIC